MTNLLFPTDFSDDTLAAFEWAKYISTKTGATITLLHVFQPILPDSTLSTIGDPGLGVMASQEIEKNSLERLEKLAIELRNEGFPILTDWRIGGIEDNILDSARDNMVDLIVMGRSELDTFIERLIGSAVTDVADEAKCPVLIVPNPSHQKPVIHVRKIVYVMQAKTTMSEVEFQTESLIKAFDAELDVLTEDQLEQIDADLIVLELYPKAGFLDELFKTNHVAKLIENSDIPLLVYHQKK